MKTSWGRWTLVLAAITIAGLVGYLRLDAPSLAAAQSAYQAGRYADADAMAARLPPDGPVLKLRLQTSLRQRRMEAAVAAYQELERSRGADRQSTEDLARTSAQELGRSRDPMIAVQGCALVPGGDVPCADRLRALQSASATPAVAAIAAAAAVGQDPASHQRAVEARFEALLQNDPSAAAEATRDLPPAIAVGLLRRAAQSGDPKAQYIAANMMGETGEAVAREPLRDLVAHGKSRSAQWAARIALAHLGDSEQVKAVVENLQWLRGADLLRAGVALDRAGRAEGLEALYTIAGGDDQLLRIEAAIPLHARDSRLSESVVEAGYSSTNPWVRARALQAAADLRLRLPPSALSLLNDENDYVRLQATRAIAASAPGR